MMWKSAQTVVSIAPHSVSRASATGVKIDNMVHVAHNCEIGRHVVIAAQTGFSGGVVIGDYAIVGGQVGVGDKARIESKAVIGSGAGILTSKIVHAGQPVWGTPARPLREHLQQLANLAKLPGDACTNCKQWNSGSKNLSVRVPLSLDSRDTHHPQVVMPQTREAQMVSIVYSAIRRYNNRHSQSWPARGSRLACRNQILNPFGMCNRQWDLQKQVASRMRDARWRSTAAVVHAPELSKLVHGKVALKAESV